MSRFLRKPLLVAVLCIAVSACDSQAPATQRPADVLARPAATAKASEAKSSERGRYSSAWANMQKPATSQGAPAIDPEQIAHEKTLQFIATSPIFQSHIDGRSFDTAIASMNTITAQLPPDVAKGFQQAARLLMISSLPIEKARAQKRNVSEAEIHAAVLQAVGNKTPWEILVAGQKQLQTYQRQAATEQQASPIASAHP